MRVRESKRFFREERYRAVAFEIFVSCLPEIDVLRILPKTIRDAGLREVVRRHFESDTVTDGEANEVAAHFTGNMRKDLVVVIQRDPEHRSRQNGLNRSFHFNCLLATHKNRRIVFVDRDSINANR